MIDTDLPPLAKEPVVVDNIDTSDDLDFEVVEEGELNASDSVEQLPLEEEFEEIEKEGKQYKIPKALKGDFMMQSDYTRKTQGLADERKAFEAERQQMRQVNDDMLNARAEVIGLDGQIKQYEMVDWQALSAQDPLKAQQLWIDFSQLKDRRNMAVQKYSQAEHSFQLTAQQEFAKRREETSEVLRRDVKGWGQQLEADLKKYGASLGYSQHQLDIAFAVDPISVKLLHQGYQYNQSLKKATERPPEPKIEPKPVQKVGGTAKAKVSPSDMTDAQFAAWRAKQIANRR